MADFQSLTRQLLRIATAFQSFCEARVGKTYVKLTFYSQALRYSVFLDEEGLQFRFAVVGGPLASHVLRQGRVAHADPIENEPGRNCTCLTVGEFLWCVKLYAHRIVPGPKRRKQSLRPVRADVVYGERD